jgi:tRNA U54 and U55 pseudouridine synthase Pus10
VAVRGLHAASPAALAALKEGEQDKEKSYCALCWAPRPLGDAELAALERMGEVEVVQQTPVRVRGVPHRAPKAQAVANWNADRPHGHSFFLQSSSAPRCQPQLTRPPHPTP